ncbi:replication protein A 70 kDa DNA-binding subunit [Trifolium repens]|nr:replication protein A 70 kDa DNA-binding subunit [Trifolium repens]
MRSASLLEDISGLVLAGGGCNCFDIFPPSESRDILPGKEDSSIRVRVVRVWKAPGFLNPSETNSLELVLIDAKGGKIHASVRKHLLQMFESKIDEGQVYQISNFSVVT